MSIIDQLQIVDGYFDGDRFKLRGIAGYAVYAVYAAEGLRSMARLIQANEPLNITIDKERTIYVPVELNDQLKRELLLVADELDK